MLFQLKINEKQDSIRGDVLTYRRQAFSFQRPPPEDLALDTLRFRTKTAITSQAQAIHANTSCHATSS